MNKRIQDGFIFSAAVALFMTAAFILLSATSKAAILDGPDPLLILSYRKVFYVAAGLELALSAFLLLARDAQTKLMLMAWLAGGFLVYDIGMAYYHEANLFVCLGNLFDWVTVPPRILNGIAYVVLGWLLLGSFGLLAWGWISGRKSTRSVIAVASPQTG